MTKPYPFSSPVAIFLRQVPSIPSSLLRRLEYLQVHFLAKVCMHSGKGPVHSSSLMNSNKYVLKRGYRNLNISKYNLSDSDPSKGQQVTV